MCSALVQLLSFFSDWLIACIDGSLGMDSIRILNTYGTEADTPATYCMSNP